MDASRQWFSAQLETPAAAPVRSYLEQRGIGRDMIAQFRLGYAPAAREALRSHLLGKGFAEKMLLDGGLLIASDRGLPFARFHDRLMFPIGDRHGKVIAFGGRVLPHATASTGMASAKYINSPETPLFHKGDVLYNFAPARKAARDTQRVVVAEGYMDVIALAQAGVPEAVAPLGTAMTEQHLRALWHTVAEPVLCLDGDAAGQRAMWRAAELAMPLLQAGQGLRFAVLPSPHDPDTLLREQGPQAVQACLRSAIPLSEAIWNHMFAEYPPTSAESSARLEKALMDMADRASDATVKRHFKQYFSDQLRAKRPNASANQAAPYTPSSGGKRGQFTPPINRTVGTVVRQKANASLDSLGEQRQQVVMLIAIAPWLLLHGEVEHALPQLFGDDQPALGWLAALEHAVHSEPGATIEQWQSHMPPAERAAYATLCEQARQRLPRHAVEVASQPDAPLMLTAWKHAVLGCELKQLQQEKARLPQLAAEEAYSQMLALQPRILYVQAEYQRLQALLAGEL